MYRVCAAGWKPLRFRWYMSDWPVLVSRYGPWRAVVSNSDVTGKRRPARHWRVSYALLLYGYVLGASVAVAGQQKADPAATLFEKQCYSCHNIGGGNKKGPDLKGLLERRKREWIHKFVSSPKGLRNSNDPTAVSLFKQFAPEEMPDQLLTPDQVDTLLDLIARVSKSGKPFIPQSGRLSRPVRPGDAAAGYRLFIGERRLRNGGSPCISCHSVQGVTALGGGTLGLDLTQANMRYTDIELASILKNPAFPTMSRLFTNQPLTDEEVVQVFAYLQASRSRTPDVGRYGFVFVLLGIAGTVCIVVVMNHVWRRRLGQGVRRRFVAQAKDARRRRIGPPMSSAGPGLDT